MKLRHFCSLPNFLTGGVCCEGGIGGSLRSASRSPTCATPRVSAPKGELWPTAKTTQRISPRRNGGRKAEQWERHEDRGDGGVGGRGTQRVASHQSSFQQAASQSNQSVHRRGVVAHCAEAVCTLTAAQSHCFAGGGCAKKTAKDHAVV